MATSAVCTVKKDPRTAPRTVPEPPKTLTPPITQAVTTSNSNPCAETALTVAKRADHMKPPSPASAPLSANARITRRVTGICVARRFTSA